MASGARSAGCAQESRAYAATNADLSEPLHRRLAGLDEPGLIGERDELCPVPSVQLVESPAGSPDAGAASTVSLGALDDQLAFTANQETAKAGKVTVDSPTTPPCGTTSC